MESVHLALIVCRFLHDGAAMLLWGAFGFLSTLAPPQLAGVTTARLGGMRRAAIALIVVTTVVVLPIETAMIGNGWADAANPKMLSVVLGGTNIGQAWIAAVVAALLLVATLAVSKPLRPAATALMAGLVLASLVLTGHAMMHEGLIGRLQQANDLLHVLASGAWVGALVPLAMMLGHPATDEAGGKAHMLTLQRFSTVGRIAVALTLLTGIANTWLIVGGWPFNRSSLYQMLLVAKIVLVAGMVTLACLNHLRFTQGFPRKPQSTAAAIRRGALGEILLGAGAIALVSVFGTLDPGS